MSRRSLASSARDRQRLERAAALYLQDCYRRRTAARVSEFAQYVQKTRPHLSRAIRAIAGQTASAFLRARQFARARQLLESTSLGIDQIAAACAFGTSRSFFRSFRREFGITPGAYRREVTDCP